MGVPNRGEKHHSARLTEGDVRLIRELFAERRRLLAKADELTMDRIGEKFGVAGRTVRDIIYYETWRHVE